jgi:hypothetical protein
MSDGYAGQQQTTDQTGDFNASSAIAAALIARIRNCTLVKVVAVTNVGGLMPVGMVDVQPMVNQLDGAGLATPHGLLHSLPYFRLQGGTDAVILDPKVGDIGIAVFADRDISSVSNTKAQANPSSGRRNSMADGLYIGGVLNGTPVQYVQFQTSGITIHSPTKITLSAPIIAINADQTITATAGTSITHNTPIDTTNAPVIGLNGNIVQTTGTGIAGVTMQGPVTVIDRITSQTEVIAVTTPLHTHQHVNGGGTGNSGNPTP